MPNLIGVTVSGDAVHVVLLTQNGDSAFTLENQTTMNVQAGARPAAYATIHGQFSDYVVQHKADAVCIKGSAVSMQGTKLVHLEAAELRGVIQAAAASAGSSVHIMTKAAASRNFGKRKVDEYLRDDDYWKDLGLPTLKKGMREAAFAAIAVFAK